MSLAQPSTVPVTSASIEPFRDLLEPSQWTSFSRAMTQAAAAMQGRRIWNISSTERGGGVAELLGWEIRYMRGVGLDARWLVIDADQSFFAVTKHLHALLHGLAVPGASMNHEARRLYDATIERNAIAVLADVRPGDVAIVHDPQPAGLVPKLVGSGARVIWRCHIGVDEPNDVVRQAWAFLRPMIQPADAYIFSRRSYVWEGLDSARAAVIPPAIDAFTPKNVELSQTLTDAIVSATGIVAGGSPGDPSFVDSEGRSRRVQRRATLTPPTPIPADARVILQVSRWDRLKDPVGVLEGFSRLVAPQCDAYLVLAGPATSGVVDDPEQSEIFAEVEARHRVLGPDVRERVRLVRLPTDDEDENAIMVNALQRRASVVVQKSLAEGFGLTVAEAMWKARPVVASRVGGIADQIEDGISGILVEPTDLPAFGMALRRLLDNSRAAAELGVHARQRITREFLAPRPLTQLARLITSLSAHRS